MIKKLFPIALALVTTISFAQNFVSVVPGNKKVILEEYTGIYCGYCPDGHAIGQALHDNNPNDIFLINIHTGGYASPSNSGDPNFNTSFGTALASNAGVGGYPTGTINRRVFPGNSSSAMSRSAWGSSSNTIMLESSPVNIGVQASVDMGTGVLTVDVETYYTSTVTNSNYLHIAVLQNNMAGPQSGAATYNPSSIIPGPWNPTYNHQHVLRHFITGANGSSISPTSAGTFIPEQFTWNVPNQISGSGVSNAGFKPDIDLTNLSIVAFIDEGGSEILTGAETSVTPIFSNAFDANVISSETDDVMCATETDISITFRNFGNQPLTSLDFNYDINGGPTGVENWTGNLLPGDQATLTVPNVSFVPQPDMFSNPGNNVNWVASNPNGQIDQNSSNNSITNKFSHKNASGDILQGVAAGNINIDLLTDNYGGETSWEIVAEDGTIIGSGGPYASNTPYNVNVAVPGNMCLEFILYDGAGDGICCNNGIGTIAVTDINGLTILGGPNANLQNFSELKSAFNTGAPTGPAWECFALFGCVEGTPGTGVYMSKSICESDPVTGCYVGKAWSCDPVLGCYDVGTAGLGDYNTEQDCINAATSAPCNGTVSINENVANKFVLFPNPAKDILNIEGNFKSIEIYDIFGKLILASDNKSEVNISSLANGSYHVNILTQDAVIMRKVTVAK